MSGGRTPRRMFERLSGKPLAWNKVKISLTDERLVPASEPASNEYLVRNELLQYEAQAAVFIPLWQGEGDPVVLIHGIPVSSFLYRKVLPLLQ